MLKWGSILSKIPKIVGAILNGANNLNTNEVSPSSSSSASPGRSGTSDVPIMENELQLLLDLLSQMATKEYQLQILQYYNGKSNYSTDAAGFPRPGASSSGGLLSNSEHRKVFKQCRRSLLLCWKYIVAQLNDEQNAHSVTDDTRDTYHQLIGLISERVEFNIADDHASSTTRNGKGNRNSNTSSNKGSVPTNWSGQEESVSDESTDAERDLYLYRCLLVATFKYVVENIEAAKTRKRSWITLTETQFYAKVLAVCFFRIPFVQKAILDQVYAAYSRRDWESVTKAGRAGITTVSERPKTPEAGERVQRRRSSSRPWGGPTFASTLSRWSEYDGHLLSEEEEAVSDHDAKPEADMGKMSESSSSSASNEINPQYFAPSKGTEDRFKRLNPSLFQWSKYVPYLSPYSDQDVFRMNDSVKSAWLSKLCNDGEFFACFMACLSNHVDLTSYGEVIWRCLPGYSLLIRVSLLLMKEAAWKKWMNHLSGDAPSPITPKEDPEREGSDQPFLIRGIRCIRSVLDGVAHLLKNKELLESCVLAMYECTNVYSAKSVGVCLTRFEEWFSAAACIVGFSPVDNEPVYRLPSGFNGHTFCIGVRIMLASESFEVLNRVLLFLYNRLDYFDGEVRQGVLKALVQRHMFLFLHWNQDVRKNYHHLLVYKVVRVHRYALESFVDQLLVGRLAAPPVEQSGSNLSDGEDNISTPRLAALSPHDQRAKPRPLTAVEYNQLRIEQALWRAFDACIASICVLERKNAREGNRKYQNDIQAARCRAIAFLKLNRKTVNSDDLENPTSSPNEGLPGGKPFYEVELLEEELNREPPYYLRYLPAEEVSTLDELRRLAGSVKFPTELHVYSALSLRGYSELLKQYYNELSERGYVEAPPLGFC